LQNDPHLLRKSHDLPNILRSSGDQAKQMLHWTP
jgi:hypothetical protein